MFGRRNPQQSNVPHPPRLAHIRQLGMGDPGWGQVSRWGLDGADPSVGYFDSVHGSSDSNLHHAVGAGVVTAHNMLPVDAPTLTRQPRTQSNWSTLPAARFFQGYQSNGYSWLAPHLNVVGHLVHGGLNKNYNPHMAGAAELHPGTSYDPFPPG